MEEGKRFNSKLLLFGEYGIMLGSKALCLPFPDYSGYLTKSTATNDEYVKSSNQNLKELLEFLQYNSDLASLIDIGAAEQDLNQGLYFHSSIPEGYGVGSSGALCAAFYDKYVMVKETDHRLLKLQLGSVEAFFHGESSGIDPLVSYLGIPFLVHGKEVKGLTYANLTKYNSRLFFVDTGHKRKSNSLISDFIEDIRLLKNRQAKQLLIDYTDRCVDAVVEGVEVSDAFAQLSAFQLHYMSSLIPFRLKELWESGLKSEEFSLKLCGAGGGGFLIGITSNPEAVSHIFSRNGLRTLFINL